MSAAGPPRRLLRLVLLIAAFIAAALSWPQAAGATRPAAVARLSVTGIMTSANSLGARVMAVHRGDTVEFRVGTVPQLDNLDLSRLLDYQVALDLHGLPGARGSIQLDSHSTYRVVFTSPGVYSFHWRATSIHERAALNGNQEQHVDDALNTAGLWTGAVDVDLAAHPSTGNVLGARGVRPASAVGNRQTPDGAGDAPDPSGSRAGTAVTSPRSSHTSRVRSVPTGPKPPAAAQSLTAPAVPAQQTQPLAERRAVTPVATYVFSGLLGFLILGMLWMLWVASIKPILGR